MVLVLGETGAGKSFFIDKLAPTEGVEIGHGLQSCGSTSSWIHAPTPNMQSRYAEIAASTGDGWRH